jgi:hypothetical protein
VVGRSTHARIRSSDDLPDPDGPTIAVTRPAGNSLSTPVSAVTSASATAYTLVTPEQTAAMAIALTRPAA